MSAPVETVFPHETIELPSKGVFYPAGSPLASGTSTNLIKQGIVLDKLMDSLILTKGVKSADLLIGDLNAVMVAARILGYGKDYPISIPCPRCDALINETIDLTTLKTENEPTLGDDAVVTVVLPISKATVVLKFLTRADELAVEKENKALKKANLDSDGSATSRLRAMITSVDGNSDRGAIWKFVDSLLVRDAKYLREQYKTKVPDVDFNVTLECTCDPEMVTVRLPIGTNFFWPDA
jgi:hypothetical protein